MINNLYQIWIFGSVKSLEFNIIINVQMAIKNISITTEIRKNISVKNALIS